MGVWEVLTKERGLGRAAFRWNEPALFRIRMRRDLLSRLAVIFAAWLIATGVLLILFAFNSRPPGILLAFGLGLVFGLGPAALLTLWRRDQVGGRIRIDDTGIHRHRNYASFSAQWAEWTDWPFGAVSQCEIVSSRISGQSFALMLLTDETEQEVIAVPSRIELKALAGFLSARGISVSSGKAVPRRLLAPLNVMTALVVGGIAAVVFAVGLTVYLLRT
jgi:hypothetical protein